MRKYFIPLISLCIACSNNNQKEDTFTLQLGDLLFQDLDSSPLCDAIEIVTPGYKGANLSHVGIIIEDKIPFCTNADSRFEEKYFYSIEQDVKVLEALPGGVKTTRIDSFLNRSFDQNNKPKVIVGRLKKEYRYTIQDGIRFLNSKIGEDYDDYFLINNGKYYCSELIHDAFITDSIFNMLPMTFIDPNTNETMSVWKDYYNKLDIEIPEGKLGINPGIMSISDKIEIVHIYGNPDGMLE